jgi:hypothetical protein
MAVGDPPRRPRGTLYPQKLALTSLLGRYSSLATRTTELSRDHEAAFAGLLPLKPSGTVPVASVHDPGSARLRHRYISTFMLTSRGSSVGTATDYGLDDRRVGV